MLTVATVAAAAVAGGWDPEESVVRDIVKAE